MVVLGTTEKTSISATQRVFAYCPKEAIWMTGYLVGVRKLALVRKEQTKKTVNLECVGQGGETRNPGSH